MTQCLVCGIEWGFRHPCESPACPCYRTAYGSAEMERAAAAWRARPSVAQARTISGAAALATLERAAWLELAEAAGELIDIVIEHRELE